MRNGRIDNIGFIRCDLREGYSSGVRRNFPNARIVYDKFQLCLIIEVTDDTARRAVKREAIKARTRHLMRMNVSKFSGEQLRTLERSIEDYRELAENYRFKNPFSNIYRRYDKESA